eukprot:gene5949-4258_t
MEDDIIMFDKNGAIRMYNPDKFDELVNTIETEHQYIARMEEFRNMVSQAMTIVQSLGKAIEQEKLRAIGNRNIVESEAEERARMVQEAEVRLREKRIELDRYKAEYDSLKKVEQFQQQTFQRLSQSKE